jgi:hypothetical protein
MFERQGRNLKSIRMKSNKELREDYKQKKFKIGVFQIRNLSNRKIFIGSSVNLDAMWNRIQAELRFGGHRNEALQNDWKAFGENGFVFEILSELKQDDSKEIDYSRDVKKLEEMFLEELQPYGENGYHVKKF